MPWSAFREGQWSWGGAWRTGLMRSGWGSWCSYLHPLPFPGQQDGLASPVLFSLSCPALYFYHRMPLSRCIIQHLLWFSFLQLESTQLANIQRSLQGCHSTGEWATVPARLSLHTSRHLETKYNFFSSLKRIIFSCESPNIPWTPVLFSPHSWLMEAYLIQLSSHFQFVFSFKDSYLHFTAEVSAFIDLSYTSSPNKTVLTLPINVVQIIKTVISCISQTH